MPRSPRSSPPPPLHELETELMEEVWRQGGETTVKLVAEALNRKAKPPLAYTTYMTVMQRLDGKRLLGPPRTGRQDTYGPRLSREQYPELRAAACLRRL